MYNISNDGNKTSNNGNRQLKRNKPYNLIKSSPNSNLSLKQSKYHNTSMKDAIKSLCKNTNFDRLLLFLQAIIFSSRVKQFLQTINMNHYQTYTSLKI